MIYRIGDRQHARNVGGLRLTGEQYVVNTGCEIESFDHSKDILRTAARLRYEFQRDWRRGRRNTLYYYRNRELARTEDDTGSNNQSIVIALR